LHAQLPIVRYGRRCPPNAGGEGEETTMGYALACGDVMPGCAATFQADDRDALMTQVSQHAAADHGITEITPEVAKAVNGAIRETPNT
jgi:predicted small metal-binding protein